MGRGAVLEGDGDGVFRRGVRREGLVPLIIWRVVFSTMEGFGSGVGTEVVEMRRPVARRDVPGLPGGGGMSRGAGEERT